MKVQPGCGDGRGDAAPAVWRWGHFKEALPLRLRHPCPHELLHPHSRCGRPPRPRHGGGGVKHRPLPVTEERTAGGKKHLGFSLTWRRETATPESRRDILTRATITTQPPFHNAVKSTTGPTVPLTPRPWR